MKLIVIETRLYRVKNEELDQINALYNDYQGTWGKDVGDNPQSVGDFLNKIEKTRKATQIDGIFTYP